MDFENRQALVDGVDQADLLGESMKESDAALRR
jgi:hypothetical protein